MELMLNDILNLTEEEIENSKIELGMTSGTGGKSKIEEWLMSEATAKNDGTSGSSYWGWYGNRRNFYTGQLAFCFIKITGNDWLFISAAEILSTPRGGYAEIKILENYKPLFGRLVIKFCKGNTYSRYVFKLKNLLDNISVKEILSCQYSGEQFEGYDRVHLSYKKLDDVFSGRIMPTYCEALKKITGIYCLTDRNTGKLYIGSASGEGGVAQRWGNYLQSKHGGNKKLIAIYKEKGEKYFEENFTFTIIESFGLSYDYEKLIGREQYWKSCLHTTSKGYNDN